MAGDKILVPFDFSEVANKAATVAASIAKKGNMQIILVHIVQKSSVSNIPAQLVDIADKIRSEHQILCSYEIRSGKVLPEIIAAAKSPDYKLMIIGSHGYKGFIEKLQGMELLKLVKEIPFPVLAVQESFQLPDEGVKTILLPGSSHKDYQNIIDATIFIAGLSGAKVLVYTVEKPGFTWSETMRANLKNAVEEFEKKGIDYERINEAQSTFSAGYAKQILNFAGKVKADMIAVMSVPTDEYYHIADSDKERLLVNDLNIPILCASDKIRF